MSEEEQALWAAYGLERCERTRNALWERYRGLARHVARRIARNLPSRVRVEDLESFAQSGLVRAIERFEVGRGLAFSTFALRCIGGAVLDGLRGEDWIPRTARARGVEALLVSAESLRSVAASNERAEAMAERGEAWGLLPRGHRVLMVLYYRGMPMRRIARLYGISEGRVSQIHQACLERARARHA